MTKISVIGQTFEAARARHVQGALDEAIRLYRQVLQSVPKHPDTLQLLGVAEFQNGNLAEAERLLTRAVKLKPGDANTYVNLGALYRKLGRNTKAIESYRNALRINPNLVDAFFNLGGVYYAMGENDAAKGAYLEALRTNPADAQVHVNLGNVYKRMVQRGFNGRMLAVKSYENALTYNPNLPEAYANIGSVFRDHEWFHASKLMYSKALAIDPGLHKYRFKRSLVELPVENLLEGWEDYEFRFYAENEGFPKRPSPPTYWDGEDLTQKKVFVWPEQGLGDQIIYGGSLPDLVARAGTVYIESKPRLAKVFARSFPSAVVLSRGDDDAPVPAPDGVDYQVPLASLGKFFRRDVDSFPRHSGYLKADPDKVRTIRNRYLSLAAGRRIVGISWRSKNEKIGVLKSADLTEWEQILRTPNVFFVNLQYGDCRRELAAVKESLGVDILQDVEVDPDGDLDDFFAQVAALDLVVSTSNTTVHTAGALNTSCWLLLPRGGGSLWYWFRGREDSPWYPSFRLFRQSDPQMGNSWLSSVAGRVARELAQWAVQTA